MSKTHKTTAEWQAEPKPSKYEIVGYAEDDNCMCCGRNLRHGVKLNTGAIVGAKCFAEYITKPQNYNGKSFRYDAQSIIRFAKLRERWSEKERNRVGVYQHHLEFEPA